MINSGDTSWVLTSAALVLLMTPGLAFFYGGLVRRKNVLSVLMQCFMALAIVSIQWVFIGYSLSFGPGGSAWIGGLGWWGLHGVGAAPHPEYAVTIPHTAFMIFQGMFAIITPALVIGSIAERMSFGAYCLFLVLWSTLVYDPIAHWIWGLGGFLRTSGALDFAGGNVVHINAGVAALVAALVIGKRRRYPDHIPLPHNLPFAVLGAGLLWFGWFGFNGGSALSAGPLAVHAIIATHIAAAAAGATWAVLDWITNSRPTVLGMITGAVAGLVAITPACGFVPLMGAIIIGTVSSLICYIAVSIVKTKLGYDDSLDAFGVHGVGGIWGAVATGFFASKAVNAAGADGAWFGNIGLVGAQIQSVAVTALYSLVMTFIVLKLISLVTPLRADEEEERIGLDITQHRESGYTLVE